MATSRVPLTFDSKDPPRKKQPHRDFLASFYLRLDKISLKQAAKFSKTSPCTNIPIRCPLCPKVSDAIWKYNLRSHIAKVHGGDVSLYQDLYTVSDDECVLMKAAFLSKPRKTRRKKAAQNLLKISEAHSTHVALSAILPIDEEDDDPDNEDPHGLDHASEDEDADSIRRSLTPTSSEEDPAESLTESLSPASYFAHSPINTPPIRPIGEVEIEQVVSDEDTNNNIEGTASQPLRATRRRKKRPSSGEISPSCCTDCDEMLTGKADSISCDGPGCDQRFHLACRGLLEKQTGGWFCDDVCRESAGFPVGKRRRGVY